MHTEKTVTTTDKKVKEAAAKCPVAATTLKTLFPDVFKRQYSVGTLFVAVSTLDSSFIIFYDLDQALKWADKGAYKVSIVHPRSSGLPYDGVIGDFYRPE